MCTFLGAAAASVVEVVDFLDVADCVDVTLLLDESLHGGKQTTSVTSRSYPSFYISACPSF